MNLYKQTRIKFLNEIPGKYKSPNYLKYCKARFPHLDLHHLLHKRCDYLVFPFNHEFHLSTVEKSRSKYLFTHLFSSLRLLQDYADSIGAGIKIDVETPAELKIIFDRLKKIEEKKRKDK